MARTVLISPFLFLYLYNTIFSQAFLYELYEFQITRGVKRNIKRFPANFMFQLTKDEWFNLSSQIETFRNDIRKYTPYAFTEQGVAMLSSVLRSEKAIQVNIQIMNTFVQMRQWAIENKDMAQRLAELEHYFINHCKDQEQDMKKIYEALSLLMDRTKPSKIGFITEKIDNK